VKRNARYETSSGYSIYQIPIEAFPGLWTFAYLVLHQDYIVLIDTGSGFGEAGQQLLEGIQDAGRSSLGNSFSIEDLTHVVITHGHIDHFGGLKEIKARTTALIGIHELDRRNITNFLERRTINLYALKDFLIEAGVNGQKRESMLDFYRYTLQLFDSVEVDFGFEEIEMRLGPFQFLHVPGHSGGHVAIRLEDILFCGDHVLADITPHQAPEQLGSWCGLNHYLRSLDLLKGWAGESQLALCGHKQVITDMKTRISEIEHMHMERLEQVLEFYRSPNTINALSEYLFGEELGFNGLLAIEEAGAHVEYLYQRGNLRIENYDQLTKSNGPVAHQYQVASGVNK
jgi:glyoxylase-like metal-dependent hydrolase (beta-lactamase superfamily II)